MNLAHTSLELMVGVIVSLFGGSLPINFLGPRQGEVRKFSTRVLGQRLVGAVDHLRDLGGEPATAAMGHRLPTESPTPLRRLQDIRGSARQDSNLRPSDS
jgi:hypothetical protein